MASTSVVTSSTILMRLCRSLLVCARSPAVVTSFLLVIGPATGGCAQTTSTDGAVTAVARVATPDPRQSETPAVARPLNPLQIGTARPRRRKVVRERDEVEADLKTALAKIAKAVLGCQLLRGDTTSRAAVFRLAWAISEEGKAVNVQIQASETLAPDFESCVRGSFPSVRFPKELRGVELQRQFTLSLGDGQEPGAFRQLNTCARIEPLARR